VVGFLGGDTCESTRRNSFALKSSNLKMFFATAVFRHARNFSSGTGGMDINATECCMRSAFFSGGRWILSPRERDRLLGLRMLVGLGYVSNWYFELWFWEGVTVIQSRREAVDAHIRIRDEI
jgi:hypothetical protein